MRSSAKKYNMAFQHLSLFKEPTPKELILALRNFEELVWKYKRRFDTPFVAGDSLEMSTLTIHAKNS
jgi:hypothetical protein